MHGKSIIELLSDVPDYRKGNAIRHHLEDILAIGLFSMICNGNTFSDMELFGETHEEMLKNFLELPYGIPSHDTLEDVSLYLDQEICTKSKIKLRENGWYERTIEQGHGRIETRECYICPDIDWLDSRKNWSGLNGIGVIVSKREETGKEPKTVRHYFLYSMEKTCAAEVLRIKRSHWAIRLPRELIANGVNDLFSVPLRQKCS